MTTHHAPLPSRRAFLRRVFAAMIGIGAAHLAPRGKLAEAQASPPARRHPHLARNAKRVADVVDFGAKADGITDDAAAFEAAVDSLVNTPGVIRLPSGRTYAIGATIKIGSGAAISLA